MKTFKKSFIKNFVLIFAIAILGLFLMPNVNASGCGVLPTSLIITCYPVNIVNNQNIATPTGLEQMLNNLPFNALTGNEVVYNGISGNFVNAWVENSTIIWIDMKANTIQSASSANGIYFIGLGASGTNFFVSGNYIGEAPQFQSQYGKYDSGNTLFDIYDNFTGTVLSGQWTTSGSSTVSNGITVNAGAYISLTATQDLTARTFESYAYGTAYDQEFSIDAQTASVINPQMGIEAVNAGSGNGYYIHNHFTGDDRAFITLGTITTFQLNTLWQDGSSTRAMINYSNSISDSNQYLSLTNIHESIRSDGGSTIKAQYIRSRTTPPNGVMPVTTYLPLQNLATVTLTITPNPNFVGLTANAQARCISNHCDIDSPLGTHLCISIGQNTCSYSIPPKNAGNYNFYANDLDQGLIANVLYVVLAYNSINCNFRTSNIFLANNITYQNNIATGNTLVIYSTTNGLMNGWQNITARFKFKAFTLGQSGTTNYTQTLYVQPNYVFRLNYTGKSSFEEQCVPIPNFIAGNGILFTLNTNSTTISVFNGIGLGFNSTGALINLNATGSSGSASPSNDNALNGVIPALIGSIFMYGYIHDLNDEEKRKDDDAKLKWFKNRYLWLAFAFSLFLSAFFVSQLTTTATSSGSTTTFNYIDNIGLTFVGRAFGFMIIAVVVVLGIARLSNVVLRLRF